VLIHEELVTMPVGDGVLQGRLSVPEDTAPVARVLVSCPHPLLGGRADNPVILAMVRGLVDAGAACLVWEYRPHEDPEARERFLDDHRILQSSPGDLRDLVGVLDWFRGIALGEDGSVPLHLAGYSYGAALSLMAAPVGARILSVSPPLHAVDAKACSGVPGRTTLVRPEEDFALRMEDLAALESAVGQRFHLQIGVSGTDHFWMGRTEVLEHLARRWMDQSLSAEALSEIPHASNLL
jgi:alpha/beta superfamily hydrolase